MCDWLVFDSIFLSILPVCVSCICIVVMCVFVCVWTALFATGSPNQAPDRSADRFQQARYQVRGCFRVCVYILLFLVCLILNSSQQTPHALTQALTPRPLLTPVFFPAYTHTPYDIRARSAPTRGLWCTKPPAPTGSQRTATAAMTYTNDMDFHSFFVFCFAANQPRPTYGGILYPLGESN